MLTVESTCCCVLFLFTLAFFPATASGTVDELLQPTDLLRIKQASSMPMTCVMELTEMIRDYSSPKVPAGAVKMMNKSIQGLVGPLTEVSRIKHNPVAFAYIAHLRLLLCIYLAALPLALVESLGWSTIPVFMVISYALLSLETIGACTEALIVISSHAHLDTCMLYSLVPANKANFSFTLSVSCGDPRPVWEATERLAH